MAKKKHQNSGHKISLLFIIFAIVFFLALAGGGIIYLRSFSFHSPFTLTQKPTLQFARLSDATLAYYMQGKGDPLVLLPGFGMTLDKWDPALLKALAKDYQLIVFDFRGVGKSTGDISHLTQDTAVSDVVGLLDVLHIRKANVLGWSSGSFTAQLLGEKYPNRITKLVLISTAPGSDQMIQPAESVSETVQNNLGGSWEEVYVPLLFPDSPAGKAAQASYLQRLKEGIRTGAIPLDNKETVDVRVAQEKMFSDVASEQARTKGLSSLHIPTLIIAGEEDILMPVENARKVAQLIPRAELVTLPKAGHGVLFQDVSTVSTLITKFLQ
jgi:pimeloyl-ACP methyl ester carboxylesterase